MEMEQKDVVFVDIYNMMYRAYHGNQTNMKNPGGMPTGAIYTTIRMLQKIPQQYNIEYALAVFDGGGDNFRKALDAEYKANRKPMPDDLKIQMPYIKRAMELLGWPMMQAKEVEADDVIGTMALRAEAKGFKVYIISSDKDFRQLVSNNISIVDTMKDVCYDRATVIEKMEVTPENVRAYLALLGDASDNVKGVDGIGSGTAIKLLNQYGSLEELIKNKDQVKNKVGENLRLAIENGQLQKSLDLVTLKTDLDIKITSKDVKMKPVEQQGWLDFCTEMNFKSFLKNQPSP